MWEPSLGSSGWALAKLGLASGFSWLWAGAAATLVAPGICVRKEKAGGWALTLDGEVFVHRCCQMSLVVMHSRRRGTCKSSLSWTVWTVVSKSGWEISIYSAWRTTTNNDDVVVRCLVATSLSATWHLHPPHPSPSVVTWRWSFAVVVVFGVWMVGDGRRWAMMGDDGQWWWWWEWEKSVW